MQQYLPMYQRQRRLYERAGATPPAEAPAATAPATTAATKEATPATKVSTRVSAVAKEIIPVPPAAQEALPVPPAAPEAPAYEEPRDNDNQGGEGEEGEDANKHAVGRPLF
jgi:hypothetical protein